MFLENAQIAAAMALGLAVFSCSPSSSKILRANSVASTENSENIESSEGRALAEIAGVNLNYENARVQVLKAVVSTQISYTFRAMVLDKDGKLRLPPGKDPKLDLEWNIRFLGTTTGDLTKLCEYSPQNLQVVCRRVGGSSASFRLAASLQVSLGDKSRLENAAGPEIDSITLINGSNPLRLAILGVGFTPSNLAFVAEKDCSDLKFESAAAMTCRVPSGLSGNQNVRVVNTDGSESVSRVSLGGPSSKGHGNELLLTYSSVTIGEGQTDAFAKIGLLRLRSDLSWSTPEWVYSASEASHSLAVPSVLLNTTQPGGPSIFTSEQGTPMEAQYNPGQGFAAPKIIASDIFSGSLQKVVFASTSVPEPLLGALALISETTGNFRVYYSESKDGENWTPATSLSPGGFSFAVDGLDPSKSALQLEFDLNGVPHVLFETRAFSGNGTGPMEATYGYRSGGGWNFANSTLINSDATGSACSKNTTLSEYQSPSLRIDASGAIHMSFVCSNVLYYGSNATGMWAKIQLLDGGMTAPLSLSQIELNPTGEPSILIRKNQALEVWSKKANGWTNYPVSASADVESATMGFDGPGGLHVFWTSSFSSEDSKVIHHSRLLNTSEFGADEPLFQHDHPITISPYHALVEGAK